MSKMKEIRVETPRGTFVANACLDEDYPGIDVEFEPKNEAEKTYPRVLFELTEKKELRVMIWADPESEDPSIGPIVFDLSPFEKKKGEPGK